MIFWLFLVAFTPAGLPIGRKDRVVGLWNPAAFGGTSCGVEPLSFSIVPFFIKRNQKIVRKNAPLFRTGSRANTVFRF